VENTFVLYFDLLVRGKADEYPRHFTLTLTLTLTLDTPYGSSTRGARGSGF